MRETFLANFMFSYTVRCKFEKPEVADAWIDWLRKEHIDDVLQAGAESAEIFQLTDQLIFEIRYVFKSQLAFEKYEADEAPRLRDEGLKKFPLNLGLEYSRSTAYSLGSYSL